MKRFWITPFLLLATAALHDLWIQKDFENLLAGAVARVEQNFDDEKRGGEGLDSRLRFLDIDREDTPLVKEYALTYLSRFLLSSSAPHQSFEYHRFQ